MCQTKPESERKRKRERQIKSQLRIIHNAYFVHAENAHMADLHTHVQRQRADNTTVQGSAGMVDKTGGVTFVDGLVPDNQGPKGPPKLYHKKSRNGCQRCRSRRVKVQSLSDLPISRQFSSIYWFLSLSECPSKTTTGIRC